MSGKAERISPQEAHEHLMSNPDCMLVCAYDSEEKFQQNHLEHAVSMEEFESRVDMDSQDQEVIFYCA